SSPLHSLALSLALTVAAAESASRRLLPAAFAGCASQSASLQPECLPLCLGLHRRGRVQLEETGKGYRHAHTSPQPSETQPHSLLLLFKHRRPHGLQAVAQTQHSVCPTSPLEFIPLAPLRRLQTPFPCYSFETSLADSFVSPRKQWSSVFLPRQCPQTSGGFLPMSVYLESPEDGRDAAVPLKVLNKRLEELGIDMRDCNPGQHNSLLCPMCKGGSSSEKSLNLFITPDGGSALWQCFRGKCGWKGSTRAFAQNGSSFGTSNTISKVKKIRELSAESLELQPLSNELLGYFAERSITAETLRRNAVMQRECGNQIVIAFPYHRKGQLVSCKYRDVQKKFWQEADTERIFYGVDDIERQSDIIIVEGEMDKLAMEEAGFRNCVSVPDGAPPKISSKDVPPEEQDTKYQYLWNCKDYLKQASRIILATDGDQPGQALAEELARRLGRERCWRVKWPKKNNNDHFKDANEVLIYMGPSVLREVVENAELYPIRGLFKFSDYFEEIDAYYHQTAGYEFGVPTGWKALKDLYNVVPGELTIVTGVPNSGKSEWIDALLCNINEQCHWKFALCSMENKVQEHARKLLEKHVKKPFFDTRYGESAERMSIEEFEEGKKWLSNTFYLIRCENDSLPSIKWVLNLAKAAVLRHGVRGLVIDPYNELDHQRPSN
ncbi:hypothetical protein CRG98_036106, partial [Punica granatum]